MKDLALIAFIFALLAGACSSAPTAAPAPSTTTTAPESTAAPATTTPATSSAPEAPATSVPSATITEAPTDPALFDYGSLGQEVAMTPTPLGSISWISSGSVPGQWILDGFPSPEPQPLPPGHPLTEREFGAAERSAPCCLVLQPIDTGLVGLGSTEWQDDNEAEFPSTWREARLLDMPCEAREWQGHANEIWFTADGVSWELLAEDVFGPEGLNMCHISMHVAEHNGTWLIIAAWPSDEVDSATDLVALTSTDLVIWDEIPLDMNHPGMQTEIISVTASNRGWAIFGSRVSIEPEQRSESGIPLGPHYVEWVAWTSADGMTYEPLDLTNLLGPPWCEPREPHSCAAIHAYLLPDALVAYVHQYGQDGDDHLKSGWRLWLGTFEG